MVAAAREVGHARWLAYLEPLPDQLRDGEISELRKVGLRARAATRPLFGWSERRASIAVALGVDKALSVQRRARTAGGNMGNCGQRVIPDGAQWA